MKPHRQFPFPRFCAACAGLLLLSACASKPSLEYGAGLDAPYVRTPLPVVRRMLELARTGKSDFVIDLGCGDGRIVISAARDFGARGAGYDIDPARIAEAKEQARLAGVEQRTSFSQQNLFRAPLARATVVTVFLMPVVMDQLAPRLLSDLAPGTRVVSHSFPVHGWKPERVEHFEGRTLYLWTIPEREPLRPR